MIPTMKERPGVKAACEFFKGESKMKTLEEQIRLSDLHGQVICSNCSKPAVDCVKFGDISTAYCESCEAEVRSVLKPTLKWTTDLPTQEGWYWMKCEINKVAEFSVVEIYECWGLSVRFVGSDCDEPLVNMTNTNE